METAHAVSRLSVFTTAVAFVSLAVSPPVPLFAQLSNYSVDFGLVIDLERLRPLLDGCSDVGILETVRSDIEQVGDLEQLRGPLEQLGIVQFHGCPTSVAGVAGVVALPPGAAEADSSGPAPLTCTHVDGAQLVNTNGEYMGRIASRFDSESIFNRFGRFGSRFSASSIWNRFGAGSRFRADSPWNRFSQGLAIVRSGSVIGRLTVNRFVSNGFHPLEVAASCYGTTGLEDPNG